MPRSANASIKLEGDASGVLKATAQTEAALDKLGKKTTQTGGAAKRDLTPAINASRSAFAALATQLLSIPGPLGQVAAQFGTFAMGGVATVAILGGLAAIAKAWELITRESREAKKAQGDAVKRLEDIRLEHKLGVAGTGLLDVETLQQVVDDLLKPTSIPSFGPEGGSLAKWETMIGGLKKLREAQSLLAHGQKAVFDRMNAATAAGLEEQMALALAQLDAQKRINEKRLEEEKRTADAAAKNDEEHWKIRGAQLVQFAQMAQLVFATMRDTPLVPKFGKLPSQTVGLTGLSTTLTPQSAAPTGKTGPSGMDTAVQHLRSFGSVLGNVARALNPFAFIVQSVQHAFGDFLANMTPVIELLGRALLPVLEALWPIFKQLAIAATYVGQLFFNVSGGIATAIGWLLEAIGKAINWLLPGNPANGLVKAGKALGDLGDGFIDAAGKLAGARGEIEKLEWQAGKAADAVGSMSSGLPDWFNLQAYRYQTASPGRTSMGSGGGAGSADNTDNSVHIQAVNIYPPAGASGAEVFDQVEREARKRAAAGATTYLDVRYAPTGAV